MDFSKNYYQILQITNQSTEREIKKNYYKLSFTYHPDKGGDKEEFSKITEAYDVLIDVNKRNEYDAKSKWGNNYNESSEFLDYEFSNTAAGWDESKLTDFKKNEILNVVCHVENFNGTIEYERWVVCKTCKGTGRDLKSKIEIKDSNGNVVRTFESEDGCDFCEGSGKDEWGGQCPFCYGQGKAGSNDCQTCKGEKRVLGKQKLTKIKFDKNQKDIKVEFMGNFSKDTPGKVGHLWIICDDSDQSINSTI